MNRKLSILRRPAILLVALAWSSVAFCGEIHDAAKSGDLEKVKILLNENPDLVFSKDDDGETPLNWAAANGYKAVAELLLANKADVNTKNIDGQTPLFAAVFYYHKDMVELLLANKADVNAKTNKGWTPLRLAVDEGHKDVAELLRQHGGQE